MKQNTPIGAGQPIRAAAIAWFREEDFPIIKTIMEDAEKLHATWGEWHLAAQQAEKTYQAQGCIVMRAILIPDEFMTFCKARGLNVDAKGRTEFANWVAMKQHGQTH